MSKKYLYKGKIYNIFRKKVSLPNKIAFEKDYIEGKDRSIMIPIDDNGRLVLAKFPLLAVDDKSIKFSLRFPRGVIDKGESPEEAARRELLEETGHKSKQIKVVGSVYPNPAAMVEKWHFFVAEKLEEVENFKKDVYEDWGIEKLTKEKVGLKIRKGEITDASAIVAFHLLNEDTS